MKPSNMVLSLIEREKMNQNCRIETQFLETDSQVVMVDEGEKETHRMSREQWVGRLDNSEDQADIKPEGKIVEEMKPPKRKLIEKRIDIVEAGQEKEASRLAAAALATPSWQTTAGPCPPCWTGSLNWSRSPTWPSEVGWTMPRRSTLHCLAAARPRPTCWPTKCH